VAVCFAADTGETPRQYRTRLRVATAVRRLRDTDEKIEAIARHVGWKSRKDLYRSIGQLTGLTPAGIRALSSADASQVIDLLAGQVRQLGGRGDAQLDLAGLPSMDNSGEGPPPDRSRA
jgi:AraC-like DNA-binding protein